MISINVTNNNEQKTFLLPINKTKKPINKLKKKLSNYLFVISEVMAKTENKESDEKRKKKEKKDKKVKKERKEKKEKKEKNKTQCNNKQVQYQATT